MKLRQLIILGFAILFLSSCTNNANKSINLEIRKPELTVAESDKINKELEEKATEAAKNSKNMEIILGYSFNMSWPDFEEHTHQLVADQKIKLLDSNYSEKWYKIYELGRNLSIKMDYSWASPFHVYVFTVKPQCDKMDSAEFERDILIRWAIKKYGSDYTVSKTLSNRGKGLDDLTYQYSWIVGAYMVHISLNDCSAELAFWKT